MKNLQKLIISVVSTWSVMSLMLSCSEKPRDENFQGTITYVQTLELPKAFLDMGVTKEQFAARMSASPTWADTIKTSYKQGNYFSLLLNKSKACKIYKADANKIYTLNEGKDSELCTVQDAIDLDLSGAPDKPVISQLDSTATIKGMLCKIVRMQWKLGKVDYYYSEGQLAVNPELFSKHTADGLADFIRMSKSLPVQIVKNAMGLDLIQTLMASQQEEINSDLFSIPTLVSDSTLNVMKLPGVEIMRVKKE